MPCHGRHRLMGVLATAAALLVALPAAAPAQGPSVRIAENDSVPLVSGNVTPLLTIPIGKPIGARFRDTNMFVTGTEGLSVYDISKPELPTPKGFLPLPHFENEDVDIGGNLLLITNDPSEGVGVLYVIDISNPSLPKLASATPTTSSRPGSPRSSGSPSRSRPASATRSRA